MNYSILKINIRIEMNIDALHESVRISILQFTTKVVLKVSYITWQFVFVHCNKQNIVMNCSILCYIIKSLRIQLNGPLG